MRIELEHGRIDDHVDALHLAELQQLRVGERGLRRATSANDVHFLHACGDDPLDRVVGGVGRLELLAREQEHARHVDRDVAVPDHDGALRGEVELQLGRIRVAVVPGDERGGRVAAGELLTIDPETTVGLRAERVDHGVVMGEQLLAGEVAPELDAAEEAEPRIGGRLLVDARHRLDLRMVGRDAGPHEAERRRELVEEIDLDHQIGVALVLQQVTGRIEAGRPGTDDRNPQRAVLGAEHGHT